MPFKLRLGLAGLLLLALAFRLPGLWANSFHADEALYASWARLIAVWRDPLLQTVPVDKPPLLFYLQALFYPLFGPVEWAARLPNWIASLLLIPLLARLAWQLSRNEHVVWGTALVAACSPLLIQFSATAFTDPLMVVLAVAALVLLLDGRPAWSGLVWGLSLAAKHQAIFYLPVLLYFAVMPATSESATTTRPAKWPAASGHHPRHDSFSVYKFAIGAAIPLALLVTWEWAQGGGATFSAAFFNFGGLRLAWSWELWPRLAAWTRMLPLLVGSPWIGALLIVGMLAVSRRSLVAGHWALAVFALVYLIFHWLTAVPVWDRFLLPLAPLAAVLVGNLCGQWSRAKPPRPKDFSLGALMPWPGIFLALLLLPGAILAANGRYPIGGLRTADQGAAHIAQFLANEPYGTVLYDHWYSWQWRYHLFDSRVYVSWFAHPDGLAEDLTAFFDDDHRRYLVVTAGNGRLPIERAVYDSGFILELVLTAVNPDGQPTIHLYRVRRP